MFVHRSEGGGRGRKKSGGRAKEVLRAVAGERRSSGAAKQRRIRMVPDEPVDVELANGSAEEEDVRHESGDPRNEAGVSTRGNRSHGSQGEGREGGNDKGDGPEGVRAALFHQSQVRLSARGSPEGERKKF
jgi:hypothetical protein